MMRSLESSSSSKITVLGESDEETFYPNTGRHIIKTRPGRIRRCDYVNGTIIIRHSDKCIIVDTFGRPIKVSTMCEEVDGRKLQILSLELMS